MAMLGRSRLVASIANVIRVAINKSYSLVVFSTCSNHSGNMSRLIVAGLLGSSEINRIVQRRRISFFHLSDSSAPIPSVTLRLPPSSSGNRSSPSSCRERHRLGHLDSHRTTSDGRCRPSSSPSHQSSAQFPRRTSAAWPSRRFESR